MADCCKYMYYFEGKMRESASGPEHGILVLIASSCGKEEPVHSTNLARAFASSEYEVRKKIKHPTKKVEF